MTPLESPELDTRSAEPPSTPERNGTVSPLTVKEHDVRLSVRQAGSSLGSILQDTARTQHALPYPHRHDKQILGRHVAVASNATAEVDQSGAIRTVKLLDTEPLRKATGIMSTSAAHNGVVPIDVALSDPHFALFGLQDAEDTVQLFRELQRPDMRMLLQRDLGIRLEKLPLEVQLHLIRFLAGEDHQTFVKLRTVLHAPGRTDEDRTHLLTSFLACAEDVTLGHTILRLADEPGADAVFREYAALLAAARQGATELTAMYEAAHWKPREGTWSEFYRYLLRDANELLRHTEQLVQNLPRSAKPEEREDVFQKALQGVRDQLQTEQTNVRSTNFLRKLRRMCIYILLRQVQKLVDVVAFEEVFSREIFERNQEGKSFHLSSLPFHKMRTGFCSAASCENIISNQYPFTGFYGIFVHV